MNRLLLLVPLAILHALPVGDATCSSCLQQCVNGIEFPRRNDSSDKSARFRPNCEPDGDKYDLGVFQTTNIEELFGEGAVNYTCYDDNGVPVVFDDSQVHTNLLNLDTSNRNRLFGGNTSISGVRCYFDGCYCEYSESECFKLDESGTCYIDKNECKENPGPCDDNATCLNDKNGTYTCSCDEGFLGNGHECQRIVSPNITSHNDSYRVREGDPVTFQCVATGYPAPNITWFRGEQQLLSSRDSRIIWSNSSQFGLITVESNLIISSTTSNDTDDSYRCVATSIYEDNVTMDSSPFIQLEVQVSPNIISYNDSYRVREGDPVTFQCVATGYPAPNITWFRGEHQLLSSMDSSPRIQFGLITVESNLTISSTTSNDTDDRYRCVATSMYEVNETVFSLEVEGKEPKERGETVWLWLWLLPLIFVLVIIGVMCSVLIALHHVSKTNQKKRWLEIQHGVLLEVEKDQKIITASQLNLQSSSIPLSPIEDKFSTFEFLLDLPGSNNNISNGVPTTSTEMVACDNEQIKSVTSLTSTSSYEDLNHSSFEQNSEQNSGIMYTNADEINTDSSGIVDDKLTYSDINSTSLPPSMDGYVKDSEIHATDAMFYYIEETVESAITTPSSFPASLNLDIGHDIGELQLANHSNDHYESSDSGYVNNTSSTRCLSPPPTSRFHGNQESYDQLEDDVFNYEHKIDIENHLTSNNYCYTGGYHPSPISNEFSDPILTTEF